MSSTEQKHPLEAAADIVGSQQRLADLLEVSKGALHQWKLPGRNVPADKCGAIERLTGGVIACETLRTDVDWGLHRTPVARRRTTKPA